MTWLENTLAMREPWKLDNKEYVAMAESIHISQEDDIFGEDWLDSYAATSILEAKYEKVDITYVAKQQTHLTISQQRELQKVLEKYNKLFNGTLGLYPPQKVHIEVEEGAVSKYSRPYSVPTIHLETFKAELKHLVRIGVLSKTDASKWASPTFIIPKKDRRIRWISN